MSMIYLVGNGYVSNYISQIKIENRFDWKLSTTDFLLNIKVFKR